AGRLPAEKRRAGPGGFPGRHQRARGALVLAARRARGHVLPFVARRLRRPAPPAARRRRYAASAARHGAPPTGRLTAGPRCLLALTDDWRTRRALAAGRVSRPRALSHTAMPCPKIRASTSARVFSSLRKIPRMADVTVREPGFLTPRMLMHRCSASSTTAT